MLLVSTYYGETLHGPWPLTFYGPWPLTFHGPWPLTFHGPWPIVCQSALIQGDVTFLNAEFLSCRCLNKPAESLSTDLGQAFKHDTQNHVASR